MTLQNIITLERLGYYDGKIKQWVKNLTVVAPDVANSIVGNDGLMTKEDKAKLDGIASGALVNIIESVSLKKEGDASASALTISDKGVTIDLSSDFAGKADKVASATNGNFAGLDANGNLTDSGYSPSSFQAAGNYKTTQTAVSDPTASGNSLSFIDTISQNTNGEISATKKTVYSAAPSTSGVGGQDGLMSAADKEKLNGIAAGAQVNVIETIKIGSDAQTVDSNKAVTLGTAAGAATTDFATSTQGGYADSALLSISAGTDGSYVTTSIGTKSGENGAKAQTVAVSVTTQAVASATAGSNGLVTALDVKEYIASTIAAGINYRGSVNQYSELPANPSAGDMYNVKNDQGTAGTANFYPGDMNYVWAAAVLYTAEDEEVIGGTKEVGAVKVAAHWDPQAPIINLTVASTGDIDSLFA